MNNQESVYQTFYEFVRTTRMVFSYQMLLLLVMLQYADADGVFWLDQTVECFARFFQARIDDGFPAEKERTTGKRQASTDKKLLRATIKSGPVPRFEKRHFLEKQVDQNKKTTFVVSKALWETLSASEKTALRNLALERLAVYFEVERDKIEQWVVQSIG